MVAAAAVRLNFDDITLGSGGGGDPFCPPENIYTLRLVEILAMDYPRTSDGALLPGHDGKPPELQFTLQFIMLDWENEQGLPYEVRGYFTLKMHLSKNSPMEPHLYQLLKAMNGGTPYDLSAFTDDRGKVTYLPSQCYDAVQGMIDAGKTDCRAVVGPKNEDEQWARIKGKKGFLPPLKPTTKATRSTATRGVAVTTPEPEDAADEVDDFA
jgi:hypothetical protein